MSPPVVPAPAPLVRTTRPVLDVAALPTEAFRHRSIMWWGAMGFMVAEGVTLISLLVSYLYVRRNFEGWPPVNTPPPALGAATTELVLLLLGLFTFYKFGRAGERLDRGALIRWLWISVAVVFAACVARAFEFRALHTRWDSDAYGSATWGILAFHGTLLAFDVLETSALALIFTLGKQEEKHYVDAVDNEFYSYFMVATWIPCYILVFLFPRWV
jgi:heme/copper-type cytochrome/quinol oxidase subunit 3